MTGEQVRAARAMLRLEQIDLAQKAQVSLQTIRRMEATTGRLQGHSTHAVQRALELAGIEFLDRDDQKSGRGEGVRFRSDRSGELRRVLVEETSNWLKAVLEIKVQDDPEFFDRPTNEIAELITENLRQGLQRSLQRHLPESAARPC
jgi:transcriptional regulator with XRE-family HTH domain